MKELPVVSIAFKNIPVRGYKGAHLASILFDSGASESFISEALADRIAFIVTADAPSQDRLADNSSMVVNRMCSATVAFEGDALTDDFYVIPKLSADIVLGMSTMSKYRLTIDFAAGAVIAVARAR